jgi:3-hydroxybutyryl-CoA dehydrogenase
MGHPGTDADVFDTLVAFQSIGMVALPLKKEQPGYIVNSLLVPLLCRTRPIGKGVASYHR